MMPIAARYADVWHCFGGTPELLATKSAAAQRDGRSRRPRPGGDHAGPRRSRSRTTSTPSPAASTRGTPPASSTSCAAGPPAGASRSRRSPAVTSEHENGHGTTRDRTQSVGPREPAPVVGDGAHLPGAAVRTDLLLGGRARPQRRRPLGRRRVRLAVPHAVREQLAVQAAEPVRVRVVLDRARRRREPRRRSATATIASRFVATVIKQGAGMGTFKGTGPRARSAGGARKGSEIIRELRAREVEDQREIVILADRETDAARREGHHLHPRQPEQRRRPQPRRTRARVDGHRARRRVERRATRPTTSTPARCSRPSRSRPSTTTRTRASR